MWLEVMDKETEIKKPKTPEFEPITWETVAKR
jgi:hypothetical protein